MVMMTMLVMRILFLVSLCLVHSRNRLLVLLLELLVDFRSLTRFVAVQLRLEKHQRHRYARLARELTGNVGSLFNARTSSVSFDSWCYTGDGSVSCVVPERSGMRWQ